MLWRHSWQQLQGEVQKTTPEHGRGLIDVSSLSKRLKNLIDKWLFAYFYTTVEFRSTKITLLIEAPNRYSSSNS